MSTFQSFVLFARDIKLSHTVFALPFAVSALLLISEPIDLSTSKCIFLLIAMLSARSFAMGMNRYLDASLDLENPRTQGRMIPAGLLASGGSLAWSVGFGAVLVVSAFGLSPLAGGLSVPLLVVLAGYSLMKRVSFLTHWYLGGCLGFAPNAVSVALTGASSWPLVLLGAGIMFWTAGFDILYATQDEAFDRRMGLKSLPVLIGSRRVWAVTSVCFALMIASLLGVGALTGRGWIYFFGVGCIGGLLGFELWLVRDLRTKGASHRIDQAFFSVNGWVSVVFLLFLIADTGLG